MDEAAASQSAATEKAKKELSADDEFEAFIK